MSIGVRALAAVVLAMSPAACRDAAAPPSAEDDTGTSTTGEDSDETGEPPSGPPLPPRPEVQTCRFDGWAPGLLPPVAFEPLDLPPIPQARVLAEGPPGILLVGTEDGAVFGVDPEDDAEPIRELRPADDRSVTGLAHGDSNGAESLFVRYELTTPARTRVTRYTFTGPRSLDPATLETLAVDHDDQARRGEGLLLTNGLLWLPLGDGAHGDDYGPADDPQQREGNLLRLDVSSLAVPYGYDLPADNPLLADLGVAAETWAWGLRDPSGCAYDPGFERVWCADRGADVSEVSLVPAASNLGWPRLEGSHCRLPGGCDGLDTQLPQSSYRHEEGECGVGPSAVVQGMDDDLDGSLVHADACSGRLFAVRPAVGQTPPARAVIGRLDPPVVSMIADPAGGIWAIDTDGRLGRLEVRRPPGDFPLDLSDSGCFVGADLTTRAPDLVPYTLNAPLWTDNAEKDRYLVLPPGTQLGVEQDGRLRFPEGSILIKVFSYPLDPLQPDVLQPVETRVMIRRSYAWESHSYAWNEEGTEAQLLDHGEQRVLLTVPDGVSTIVRHTFPSRDECGYCHGNGDVRALGPRLDQLAREVDYSTGTASQLEALESIGLFETPPTDAPVMADYRDPEASDEDRARAYLHANCGHCHRPGGWTPPDLDMDLRWSTPTSLTALCGVPPQYTSTFQADHRISPGDPGQSLVWLRLSSRGPWQMPPFATSIPDPEGLVVREWIEGLDACPEEP